MSRSFNKLYYPDRMPVSTRDSISLQYDAASGFAAPLDAVNFCRIARKLMTATAQVRRPQGGRSLSGSLSGSLLQVAAPGKARLMQAGWHHQCETACLACSAESFDSLST